MNNEITVSTIREYLPVKNLKLFKQFEYGMQPKEVSKEEFLKDQNKEKATGWKNLLNNINDLKTIKEISIPTGFKESKSFITFSTDYQSTYLLIPSSSQKYHIEFTIGDEMYNFYDSTIIRIN